MLAVVIPARDEAQTISRVLSALSAQRGAPPFTTLVVANNCTDDTASQSRLWVGQLLLEVHEVTLPPEEANVVGARRVALNTGAHLAGPDGVIVSTDADTVPSPDWLAHLVAPLAQGYDASAGRILLHSGERERLPAAIRATHLLDTGYRMAAAQVRARLVPTAGEQQPTHWQHFGASLALKVEAYRVVGELPQVPCLEDVALVAALNRHDLRLKHTHQAKALTSARRVGRVPVGLSTQLGEWACGPEHWTVPGGAEVVAAAHAEQCFRAGDDWRRVAAAWRVGKEAAQTAQQAQTQGLGLEHLMAARDQAGHWRGEFAAVPVRQALQELRSALAELGGYGFQTVIP